MTRPEWFAELAHALELGDVPVTVQLMQQVVGRVPDDDEATTELSAGLVGFLAGYATGLAEGTGQADFDRAHRAALKFISGQLGD